jgi:hypothetical protein
MGRVREWLDRRRDRRRTRRQLRKERAARRRLGGGVDGKRPEGPIQTGSGG